jgi:RimJ/RimL family protein N-acetyltransferase
MMATPEGYLARPTCNGRIFELADAAAELETERLVVRDLRERALDDFLDTAGVSLNPSGEPVGVLDWIEENPSDGKPWVGLVMIRADRQRRGLASEALDGLADRLRASGARSVRAGVLARNPAGRALLQRLGVESVSTTTVRMTSEEEVIVLERDL